MRCMAILAIGIVVVGCGGPDPLYGEVTLSSAAPRVTASGTTFGEAAAMELAPGCPGYLDVETPGHVLHVTQDVHFTVQVRSDAAPLALAVAHGDEVRCDSDEGSGHAPTLEFEQGGDYQIYVAALREPAQLAYELTLTAAGAEGQPVASRGVNADVSVTITSQPPGAQVTDPNGAVIGTTPAMFVLNVPRDQLGESRTWTLSLADHQSISVTGQLGEGALVLHGQLPALGPTIVDVTASESQPIRDYQSASLAVEVAESCAITEASVEVDIRHSFVGDLRVVLRPPWGEELMLHRHSGGGRRNLQRTWRSSEPAMSSLVGRDTRGRWTLIVHDDAGADQGSLERFDLHLSCGSGSMVTNILPPPTIVDLPTPTSNLGHAPTPNQGNLPDLPTRSDIVRVLGGLRPTVERCGTGTATTNVRVIATVTGASGHVSQVSSTGSASASERQCVERVVRTARFPRFRRQSLDVDYTYAIGPTAAAQRRAPPRAAEVLDPWASP